LDKEVKRATARRDKAAAMLKAEDAALEALLKAQAELFDAVAANHELHSVPSRPIVQEMLGQNDSRALKIAKSRSPKRGRAPEVQAIYDAGLTPNGAAQLCGTTRDVLKQAWGVGSQFREIKPEWKKRLAKAGVPESVWRTRG
jgi:hypothetical protein